jgi:hypothetical protein
MPGIFDHQKNRRTIRGPVNPMDKSTIVSIYPKEITENKPTMQPGIFVIPAGTFDKPATLVVGPSSWWREFDEQQPLLEIPVSSIQVADSVVKDYCNGLLGCDMSGKMPGLFYLPGEHTAANIIKEYMPLLLKYRDRQKAWFLELIKIADILWARSNGNPLAISDDARFACKELNIQDKPWLQDHQTSELVRCIACGNLNNPQFPVCPICHAVTNSELAKKLNIQFATT